MTKINCILLVDDDETTNYLNELLIKQLNICNKILVAKNGQEALRHLHENWTPEDVPTLILLDIKMPVMNGFEFMEAFGKAEILQKETIKIVMLTTSLHPLDMEQLKRFEFSELVTKPLTAQSLKDVISRNFGKPQATENAETLEV